jgi:uncharacterized lipoprotein YddW (UPF0748 family)
MNAGRLAALLLLAAGAAAAAPPATTPVAGPSLKGRAVWAHPRDAGTTEASVAAFAGKLAKAHVNTVVMEVKTSGGLFWPSERFAPAVLPEYRTFDFPAVLVRECHERGIAVHAWFFDFAEGGTSYVAQQHPEWLARSPAGLPTTAEVLRGRPYGMAWMCPARRPGYTDQWLVPLIREFVERYDVDAVHHDYVRYPGDLAPDTYCFCDYCLAEIPRYASLYSEALPDDPLLARFDRPHLEAHWERSPRVLPPNWGDYSREMKSRFLLEGGVFPGGRRDLDSFFYEYRAHQVAEFTRLVAETVHRVRPKVEFSAAVFKNPVQSGRFIGQDWRRFSPWVQYLMPMDYRSHYGGATFDEHLELLSESIRQQRLWARDFPHYWPGVAAYQIYEGEREPLVRLRALLRANGEAADMRGAFRAVASRLEAHAPDLHGALDGFLSETEKGTPAEREALAVRLDAFLAAPPAGYFPPERLTRLLERVRDEGVEGLVIFSTAGLTSAGLWDAVGEFFAR